MASNIVSIYIFCRCLHLHTVHHCLKRFFSTFDNVVISIPTNSIYSMSLPREEPNPATVKDVIALATLKLVVTTTS